MNSRSLEPIKTIEVDFGKPTSFTPPSTQSLIDALGREARDAEDAESGDLAFFVLTLWEDSLTPSEKEEYSQLCAAERAAAEHYNPSEDPPDAPSAAAYFKANADKTAWMDSHGAHICYTCSYYFGPQREEDTPFCFKHSKIVSPTCLACPSFSSSFMGNDIELVSTVKSHFANSPLNVQDSHSTFTRQMVQRFADRLKSNKEVVDFAAYTRYPNSYEYAYSHYPEILATTRYPTLEIFKAAQANFVKKHPKHTTTPPTPPTTPHDSTNTSR